MSRLLVLLVLFVGTVLATRNVILNRDTVPKSWIKMKRAPGTAPVNFMIALKQRNLDLLDSTFWAIATPGSPQYRNFMTIHEIADMVAPLAKDHDQVIDWIKSNGITDITSFRDAIEVHTTVELANRLFHAQYYSFQSKETGKVVFKIFGKATMPVEIERLVDFVEGISTFPIRKYKTHGHKIDPRLRTAAAAEGVIPETCALNYNIPALTSNAYPESSVSAIEFEAQCYSPKDLQAYAKLVDITVVPITKNHTVGPNDPNSAQLEATLDVQFIATINNAATSWFWLETGDGWLYQYVNHMFNTQDIPFVQSISYGWSENDQCDIDGAECQKLGVDSEGYVTRVNAEFQKIAMRGISIFVASGDSGANGRTDPDCSQKVLLPDYPAACPYITSVGATQFNTPVYKMANPPPICTGHGYKCVSSGNEVAVSFDHANFASGGGFSNYAPMPDYQSTAVKAYLASGVALPPASYYNASNRAYPDVAAVGSDVLVYQDAIQDVGGTSASSPAFAAVAAILNHYAITKSGKPLGFLNPLFYQMAAADPTNFHDIIVGDNKCTEDGCGASCKGYLCTKGWDPVTGLGSPNTANMIAYIQKNL